MAAANTTTPRIVQLADEISRSVAKFKEVVGEDNLPSSFEQDSKLPDLPQEASDIRDAIIDATTDLQDLLLDPLNMLTKYSAHNSLVSLQIIGRSKIANIVPASGQISFEEIAEKTGLSESMTKRMLRHAMTMHIFREPVPGMVAHTTASKALQTEHLNAWLDCGTHEMWPAATRMVDAALQWPDSQDPHETAYTLVNGNSQSIYEIAGTNPTRALRFAGAMEAFAASPAYDTKYIVDDFDWAKLGEAHVVDLGGAQGHVAIDIARRFPGLKFTVQDMGQVIAGAEAKVPEAFKDRISFMGHDLFTPQTVQADAYLIRWVLHNWPDQPAIAILRAQIPMLKQGTSLIINETCMPEPGTIPLWRERNLRAADLNMGAVFNARERTVEEWRSLLAEADPRFSLEGAVHPKGSALSILHVVWNETQ